MINRRGTYYLSRIIKIGEHLTHDLLIEAINNSSEVIHGKYKWSITDVEDKSNITNPYIFGNLSKYHEQGEVKLIDEVGKKQVNAVADDLLKASTPFVYLPDYSGIAYMHVWNDIDVETFPNRFEQIIKSYFDDFFVDCKLDPVSDLRSFLQRLESLEKITEINAKVHPTNPLFGRLWSDLDKYVKGRNADQVEINEKSNSGLNTRIKEFIREILKSNSWQPAKDADLADAAILMAADGYGVGKAIGIESGEEVQVETSKSRKTFLFSKTPNPEQLANKARKIFAQVSKERDMKH
ncbi:hypothetical protein [Comamonas sp.]|uniref:hypothetical protein n=1 Tax=Comamonas sp. TaxID=34028 RepID=UPI00289882E8|nr:hypothetical protein [Comamonas sp.]